MRLSVLVKHLPCSNGEGRASLQFRTVLEWEGQISWGGVTNWKSDYGTARLSTALPQLVQIFHGLTFKLKEWHFQEFENKAMCENMRPAPMPLQEIGCIPFPALKKSTSSFFPQNAIYVNDPQWIFLACAHLVLILLNFKNMPIVPF